MSYILDALKKSEQERMKGTVPRLGTIQDLPGSRLTSNWRLRYYLAGTLVFLVATGAIAWIFLREPLPSQIKNAATSAPPQIDTPINMPAPKTALPEISASPSSTEGDRRPGKQTTATTTNRQRPLTPAPISENNPKNPIPSGVVATQPDQAPTKLTKPAISPPPEASPLLAMERTPPQKATPEIPKAAIDQPQIDTTSETPSDPSSEEPEAVVVKPEDMPIVPLAQLPAEIKSEMTEVKIGIHFYSDDPISRRAGVNGRLLREGQQVDKDITLKEITRDGAILSFRGRRFSLAVFPR